MAQTGTVISMHLHRALPYATILLAALHLSPQLSAQAPDNTLSSSAAELDWMPRNELTEDLSEDCPRGCTGIYVPPGTVELQGTDPAASALQAEAGRSELDGERGSLHLTDRVIFTQGWRRVTADEVIIDRDTHLYQLLGNISIREPGLLLRGASATVQGDTNEITLSQASYLLHEFRAQGAAETIRRQQDGRIFINNATYSTCEPHDQDWRFEADEIEIDPTARRIIARDMQIKAGPVTLFYAPYFSFPLGDARKTGLLYPVLENSGDNGIDYAQPIYLNLAPNYDLTLTPRFIEKRGAMLESRLRWLYESGDGTLETAYLHRDQGGDSDLHHNDQRWFGQLRATQDAWGGTWDMDYSAVSDAQYFADLGNASLQMNSQTWMERRLRYRRQTEHLEFNLSARSYEDLTENDLTGFSELPRMQIHGRWQSQSPWYGRGTLEWVAFEPFNSRRPPESALQRDGDGDWISGSRARLDYRAGWRMQGAAGFIDLGLMAGHRQYQLNAPLQAAGDDTPRFSALGLILDSGLNFERETSLLASGGTQSLDFRLQYVRTEAGDQRFIPIFDTLISRPTYQSLFRANPFQGGDRISDANRLSLGVETGFSTDRAAHELVRLGLAQQFYFQERATHASSFIAAGLTDPSVYAADDPRRLAAVRGARDKQMLEVSQSSLTSYLEFNPSQRWYSRLLLNWSHMENEIDFSTFELGFRQPDSRTVFNLAYHYEPDGPVFRDRNEDALVQPNEIRDGTIEQLHLSAVIEVTGHWTLMGKWQRDLNHQRELEILAGARYDACCWSASLVWRDWLERDDNALIPEESLAHDSGIFVSFELKGLAGVGERLQNFLSGSIPGY